MKRSADHVSDENPQSVDPESVPKPDEFSPPAPATDKQMLSPIKSPQSVKSPSKRTTTYATDKVPTDSVSGKTKLESSEVYCDRYDSIKSRERKKSTSNSGTDSIKEPKQKPSRSHKPKQRVFTPKTVPDDSSSSESDLEMSVSSSSPVKSLPKSPRKSLSSSSNDSIKPSSMPSRSSSSKKESKNEKLRKEQNSVKLKRGDTSHFKVDCDSSSKAMSNMHAHSDDLETDSEKAMKDIFDHFPGRKLLSPIAGDSENISESLENVKNVKSEILPVKNILNASVKFLHGKPSVLVQIDLNLLKKIMFKDKGDPNLLRVKPEIAKRLKDNVLLGKGNPKASKVTSAKHGGTDIANKSHQVLHTEPEVRTGTSSTSHHSANNSHISANSSSTTSANSNERTLSDSVTKPKVSDKVVFNKSVSDDMPDFDSLPIREPVREEKAELSDSSTSVGSDSSDSEIEDDSKSSQLNLVSSHPVSFNQSPPDIKKRKLDSHRADDSKRRKTSSSKVLHNQSTPEKVNQKSYCDLKR